MATIFDHSLDQGPIAAPRDGLICTGGGATAGPNRLVHLLGTRGRGPRRKRSVVLTDSYEHHCNILPWRKAGAKVIEIRDAPKGGVDLVAPEAALRAHRGRHVVGAFSAASNITGIVKDVVQLTRLLKAYAAMSVWDRPGGAADVPISMKPGRGAAIGALVCSPHKFPGRPGASVVLILRKGDVESWPRSGSFSQSGAQAAEDIARLVA